jgi:6-pyruvoyltetrahydropterin/6-carboxytetrahydropterin synthase
MVGEKCENLHGHNWKVEVCIGGERLNTAGVLMDFGDVKRHVADIIQELDHKFLNELPFFQSVEQPSSERIAVYIAEALQQRLTEPGVHVTRVSAWESDDACATYILP